MNNVILCGDTGDSSVSDALIPALARYGGVRYAGPEKILERGGSARFFLYECDEIPKIELAAGILLFQNSIRQQRPFSIPPGFLCVLQAKNIRAAELLGRAGSNAVTCGASSRDTLSIAGLESSGAALSLQRSLPTLDGRLLEPHDFTVSFSGGQSPTQLLAVCAVLLIAGIDSSKGFRL